jgi:hypothetical protein
MTPDQVDALDDDVYLAFIRHMEREAVEIEKASARARRR